MSLTTIKILNSHSLSILQTNRICERRKDVENFTVPEKLLEIKKKLAKKFFIGFAADASNIGSFEILQLQFRVFRIFNE